MQSSQPPKANKPDTSHTHYLFPGQDNHPAYSVTDLKFKENISHARVGYLLPKLHANDVKEHCATKSQTFDSDAPIHILPNGYFFRLVERTPNQRYVCLAQVSMLGKRCLTSGVDVFIDTSMAAMLFGKDEQAICGVNTIRDRVYQYTFKNSEGNIEITSPAICVYDGTADKKQIASIAGCPNLKNNFLVISFTDGEVVAGCVVDNKFVRCFTPHFADKKEGPIHLVSSPDGHVVLFQPGNKHFMICKFSYNGNFKIPVEYAGTTLINSSVDLTHVSLSPNGATMTGLQADNTKIAHVYDTTNGNHHELKLSKPVCDLVVSGDNDVAVMVHDPLDTGHDTREINILGKLDKVLESKHDVQIKELLTVPVSKLHMHAIRRGHKDHLLDKPGQPQPFGRK